MFELVLTIALAAVTGGVGAVAALGSKARLVGKFKKVGDLLMDFVGSTKKLLKAKKKRGAKGKKPSFDELKTNEVVEVGPIEGPPKSPKDDLKSRDDDRTKKPVNPVDADRTEINRLSKEAEEARKAGNEVLAAKKIGEAREILKPHLPKMPGDSWDAVVERLDVSSPKDGAVFWSGSRDNAHLAAEKFAEEIGGVRLETTKGGRIIDGWADINNGYPWDASKGDPPPYAGDLWGAASKKYAEGATGKVNVVQSPYAAANGGGPTWIASEKDTLEKSKAIGKVSEINFHVYDKSTDTLTSK